MSSLLSENLACFNCNDFMINEVDVLKLNSVHFMSLLEEPQDEEYNNDEQLDSIIRSLEAEINPEIKEEQVSVMETRFLSSNAEVLIDDEDCSESLNLDFAWDNMELQVASLPDEDLNMYMYMDSYENDHMDGAVNDRNSQFYCGFSLEDQGCYSSLWHETHNTMMC